MALQQEKLYTIEDIYALPNGKRAQLLDYGIKLFKYRTAGVREYWIINPATRTENVYDFEHDKATNQYEFDDKIPVCIYDGFSLQISGLL